MKVYNSDGTIERQVSGETVMHEQWSGKALATRQQKPTIKYVYPKEGVIGWMDNVAVPTGAPDLDNAKKFLNFLMDPENIALQQKSTGYQSADRRLEQVPAAGRRRLAGVQSAGRPEDHLRAGLRGKGDARLRQDLDGPAPVTRCQACRRI